MDRRPTSISHKYTDFRSLQLIAAIPHERANARAPDTSMLTVGKRRGSGENSRNEATSNIKESNSRNYVD